MKLRMLQQGRDVWIYVGFKTVKNSLPFFSAVFALLAPMNLLWLYAALGVLVVHVILGIFVDASFFYAVRTEIRGE